MNEQPAIFSDTRRTHAAALVLLWLSAAALAQAPSEAPPWRGSLPAEANRRVATLVNQVTLMEFRGRFDQAVGLAEQAQAIQKQHLPASHYALADSRRLINRLKTITKLPEPARAELTSSVKWQLEGLAALRKNDAATALGRFGLILRATEKHLGSDHPATARAADQIARLHVHAGRTADALAFHQRARDIRRKSLGQDPLTAASEYETAFQMGELGRHLDALKGFQAALRILETGFGASDINTAIARQGLANCHANLGELAEAERLARRSVADIAGLSGHDAVETTRARDGLALILRKRGRIASAQTLYEQTLATRLAATSGPEPRPGFGPADVARSLLSLADCHSAQGRDADARGQLQQALAMFRKNLGEKHRDTATCLNNLGSWYFSQGRHAEADQFLQQAFEIRAGVLGKDHPDTAQIHFQLANNFQAQGEFDDALKLLDRALVNFRKQLSEEHADTARVLFAIAETSAAQGDHDRAGPLYRQALAIRTRVVGPDHADTVESSSGLAFHLYDQGDHEAARDQWARAAEAFEQVRLRVALTGLGRAVASGRQSPLQLLAAAQARTGDVRGAWDSYEKSLARGLLDDLAARQQQRLDATESARRRKLLADFQRIEAEITVERRRGRDADLNRITTLRRRQLEVQATLGQLDEEFAGKHGHARGEVMTWQQVQLALPADTALVGWLDVAGREHAKDPNGEHWVVLLRRTGPPRWIRLPGNEGEWFPEDEGMGADLASELTTIASQGIRPASAEPPELVAELAVQRFEPLKPHLAARDGLPDVAHLVVLPSTALKGLPVELIATPELTISYAPSGTLLARLGLERQGSDSKTTPKKPAVGLFALGDPVFDEPTGKTKPDGSTTAATRRAFKPLPATRWEVGTIARVFERSGNGKPQVLLGSEANEQNLARLADDGRLGRFRFLHLATHGVPDNQRPMKSRLILSRDRVTSRPFRDGTPPVLGELTAGEILSRWNLDADLVVLSACQSGLGRFSGGEGYLGFAQALLLAGGRSLLLSLWEVDDQATALLMTRFYENLLGARKELAKPLSKARALAEAKRWLRRLTDEEIETMVTAWKAGKRLPTLEPVEETGLDSPYGHPVYWAAFILVGDPR